MYREDRTMTTTTVAHSRPESPPAVRPLIVAVDDEPNILSALRRCLRPLDAEFASFETPSAALSAMALREPSLIISDMRMPEMDGAEFLAQANVLYPQSLRILLTGYSDHDKGIEAVNAGGIWKHLAKPWDEHELLQTVTQALRMRTLAVERDHLEALTRRQRDELQIANQTLETRVDARTRELSEANARLDHNFSTLVKVISGIVDARFSAGRTRRIADIARSAAAQLGVSESECDHIFRAALLHPVGRMSLPDSFLSTRKDEFTHEQVKAWRAYPVAGEDMLMPLRDLVPEAGIIRSHCERFDGLGFPDGRAGDDIIIGARVLAAAIMFDELLGDDTLDNAAAVREAVVVLSKNAGQSLCPECCQAIVAVFRINASPSGRLQMREQQVECHALLPGMELSRDALAASGTLLLSSGHQLTATIIAQLQAFQQRHGTPLRFWISSASAPRGET